MQLQRVGNDLVTKQQQNDTEEQISEWPGRQSSENHPNWTEKIIIFFENEDSLRDFWDNIKQTNICILGVLEGEEREKWGKLIWRNIS